MRYFVRLSYNGTAFHGWQFQPNGISVQEALEKAFSTILQVQTAITGAGRTDAGVHAKNFIAHFDMEHPVFSDNLESMVYKLNALLPPGIVVHEIYPVAEDAHARFDAYYRTYHYYICKEKDPFKTETMWLRYGNLDIDLMNNACEILKEYNDFTSFAKLHADTKTNICDLKFAHWKEEDKLITFEITANRFLRNMVRSIVGTMVDLGRHKINLQEFRAIIEAKDRGKAGVSAPAQGLFLTEIGY